MNQLLVLADQRTRDGRAATKREFGALLALVAFEPADPFPILRLRHHASAKSDGFSRGLIRHTQMVFHASGD